MGSSPSLPSPIPNSPDMKVALCSVVIIAVCNAESWIAGPYTLVKRAAEPRLNLNTRNSPGSRFFSGNNPLDAGATGAALGAATHFVTNQIFNPCSRGGNTRNNYRTNQKIFGSQEVQSGALGFLAGFTESALIHYIQGSPCG